jgi:pyruvate formate lyase activating enzyme
MRVGGLQRVSLLDYPGRVAAIVFTRGCNWRCPYCHNPDLVQRSTAPDVPTQGLLSFLEGRRGLLDGVVITGGEPTVHPGLVGFARSVKAMGFLVKVDTNGSDPALLRRLLAERAVDYLAMDVKGSPDRYPDIVRRPVEMEEIRQSIGVVMKSGVDYEFRVTVLPRFHDEGEMAGIGRLLAGARTVYLQNFRPGRTWDPTFAKDRPCSPEALETFRRILEGYVERCLVRDGRGEADGWRQPGAGEFSHRQQAPMFGSEKKSDIP